MSAPQALTPDDLAIVRELLLRGLARADEAARKVSTIRKRRQATAPRVSRKSAR